MRGMESMEGDKGDVVVVRAVSGMARRRPLFDFLSQHLATSSFQGVHANNLSLMIDNTRFNSI